MSASVKANKSWNMRVETKEQECECKSVILAKLRRQEHERKDINMNPQV
jgi:hypothetical protein